LKGGEFSWIRIITRTTTRTIIRIKIIRITTRIKTIRTISRKRTTIN